MNYSIVIPVFNKAELTRHCLQTLRPTLEGAGEGEVIVIDNASSDETPEMLREFPWARVVRNERNLGFAGANNQGARLASGRFLVMLNNDTEARPGWLAAMLAAAEEPNVGAVGAKLLFPDGTLQHAGVGFTALRFGSAGFLAQHEYYMSPADYPPANVRRDLRCVTAACMVTPMQVFRDLGGLDETFWNGYEDVNYCLRLSASGLRVVYEPAAVLTHFESQSGVQRFRRVGSNVEKLANRWKGRVVYDRAIRTIASGMVQRERRASNGGYNLALNRIPATTLLVHGDAGALRAARQRGLPKTAVPVERVLWVTEEEAVEAARAEMERRGDRYLALLDARTTPREGWLEELVRQAEFSLNVGAATHSGALPLGEDVNPLAADARCTLLSLSKFPQHERLGDFASLDAAVADLLTRSIAFDVVTRGVAFPIAELAPRTESGEYQRIWGRPIAAIDETDGAAIEERLRAIRPRERGLVSIVTLSWNAPQYTKLALDSIRAYTSQPYEVIVVDNGSGPETTNWLRAQSDVTVIYNERNLGFAAGCNQGIAAANGEYVVLLNNDVVVTEGWLDGLLDAFDRVPALGISAVRSNRVAGDQLVIDVPYDDIPSMHAYAARRRAAFRRQGYFTDRAIGLCLCIDRRVIDEIGGIDERFGVGNFEDDDFCLRARAAGYRIYVCDDVFIHHFGSRTFAANNVEYGKTMSENWKAFSQKWGLAMHPGGGYESTPAIRRGFSRAEHYVALPAEAQPAQSDPAPPPERRYALVIAAVVENERDWNLVGALARRYLRAFAAEDAALLAIAARGELDAATIGERLEKTMEKAGVEPERSPDVSVGDEDDVSAWIAELSGDEMRRGAEHPALLHLAAIEDATPSGLRRLLRTLEAAR